MSGGTVVPSLRNRGLHYVQKTHQEAKHCSATTPTSNHVQWEDKILNKEILRKANVPSVEATITKAQLRWAGNVSRMDDSRLPKAVRYGELSKRKSRVGRLHLRY